MTEIRNRDNDKREERLIQEKKAQNRRDLEKKMQYEPMKTFEAKLAEKTAHEITTKESQIHKQQELKSKEEKQSLVDKLIGEASKQTSEEQHQKVAAIRKEAEEESKKSDKSKTDTEYEAKKGEKSESSKTTENKKGEVSSEGYMRVAEKEDDQGGAGGGGMESDNSGQDSGEYESGQRLDKKDKFASDLQKSNKAVNRATGTSRSFGTGTFDAEARDFDQQNLDEIVSSVQLGINEEGDEEFSVQLSDEYFDGVTVQATRTDEGVILKFICPNITVRSTFIKFRVKVYAHFKRKDIDIHRIDVI